MPATVDVELIGGLCHAEFIEEHVRHVGVEMLARMHQHLAERTARHHCV
jgi:Ser/Thr protein kinase RdoA (MazF antagonist)